MSHLIHDNPFLSLGALVTLLLWSLATAMDKTGEDNGMER